MKIYFLGNLKNDAFHAGNKARQDCESIFKKLEMKKISLDYFPSNKFLNKHLNKLRILLSVSCFLFKKDFIIFSQFPVERKKGYLYYNLKNGKTVSIIHDLDGLRFKEEKTLKKEIKYLKKSEYIISHNYKMTEFLIKNGIQENKIKNLNIFDYILEESKENIELNKTSYLCFAGNLEKSPFIYKLKCLKNIKIDVFGVNYKKELNKRDFNYCGAYPPDEIHKKLSGKYGLIWDGDSLDECNGVFGEYLKYNNPHKLSLYIAAGLPVVTWKKAAISKFIEDKNIGITVNSLHELDVILPQVTQQKYEEHMKNVLEIRKKIINGDILKNLIEEFLTKIETKQ